MSKFLDNLEREKARLLARRRRLADKIMLMEDEQKLKEKELVKSPYRAKCILIEKSALIKIDLRLEKIQQYFHNATKRLDAAFMREQALVGEISLVQGEIYDLAYKSYLGLITSNDKAPKYGTFNIEDRIFTLTQKLERLRSTLEKRRLYRVNNLQPVDRTESDLAYEEERAKTRKEKRKLASDATTIAELPDNAVVETFKLLMKQRELLQRQEQDQEQGDLTDAPTHKPNTSTETETIT